MEQKWLFPATCRLRVFRDIHIVGELTYPAPPGNSWEGQANWKFLSWLCCGRFFKNCLGRHLDFPRESRWNLFRFFYSVLQVWIRNIEHWLWNDWIILRIFTILHIPHFRAQDLCNYWKPFLQTKFERYGSCENGKNRSFESKLKKIRI